MVYVPVQCPHCHSPEVIKAGKQVNGTQRYRCLNDQCARRIFLLQYQDRGRVPEIRRQVVDLALNGSGIRDTARVLRMRPTTVIAMLKKSRRAPTGSAIQVMLCAEYGRICRKKLHRFGVLEINGGRDRFTQVAIDTGFGEGKLLHQRLISTPFLRFRCNVRI
jgi:transposase-like protein